MKLKPEISVVVTAYNHEKYIAQALDSILMQQDCPAFEIIIGNDCSTDNTGGIVAKYAQKYPEIIKILPREKNLGMLQNMKDCFENCQGDFIAICEGDDYWTDKLKLKKQVEALKTNIQALMCFTDIELLIEAEEKTEKHLEKIKKQFKNPFTIEDLIKFGNPVANFSCCMYKKESLQLVPDSYYENKKNADWLFNMYVLDNEGCGIFLNDICSVYRILKTAQWSKKNQEEMMFSFVDSSCSYNKIFSDKYIKSFLTLIQKITSKYAKENIKNIFKFKIPVSKNKSISFEINKIKKQKQNNEILAFSTKKNPVNFGISISGLKKFVLQTHKGKKG